MGSGFVRRAALFYGLLVVAAALWNGLRGRDFAVGNSLPGGILLGLLTAAGTVFAGLALYRIVPVMRKMAEELAPELVDRMGVADLILISIFSGVGEEMFFRGTVQPEFGITVAALAFGLVHIGPDRRYLIWTIWAILAGFLFGFLYSYSGGLVAPVIAHSLHNAATFLIWKRSRKRAPETGL